MLNKVHLIGNLGKDPELRYTASGTAVATFSVATTETFKDKAGTKQETTTWHNIVVWKQLAEVCEKFLSKGKKVYLEGKINNRSYDDRDGNKKYISEIVAQNVQFLSPQESTNNQQNTAGSGQQAPQTYQQPDIDPSLPEWDDSIPY